MNLIFGIFTAILRRGIMPALILGLGWYGGAKYGAPDLLIRAVDGLLARGEAVLSPIFDRGIERGGEIVSDAVAEGGEAAAGAVEQVLEDLAEPGEKTGDEPQDNGDAAAAQDEAAADEAAADGGAAATPVIASDGDIILCATHVTNAPRVGADGIVAKAGATVRKNGVTLLLMPATKSCLSSGFGIRDGKLHSGVDYFSDTGGDVLAAGAGVIRERVTRSDFGNMIVIDHGEGVFTRYAHLAGFASGVSEGASVQSGQLLGPIGSSGASSIVHLHYEILTGEYADAAGSFGLDPIDPFSLPSGR